MKLALVLGFATAAVVVASPATAQRADTAHARASAMKTPSKQQAPKKENLRALTKISRDSARIIAMGHVAKGSKVKAWELEREKGTIVYSFDITVPKQPGVEEILVSAIDGSVVSQTHETPAQEKAEARKEAAPKKP